MTLTRLREQSVRRFLRKEGELQFLNTKVFEYTGKSLEDFRDPGWRDSLHPEDIEAFIAQWKAAMRAGVPITIEFHKIGRAHV